VNCRNGRKPALRNWHDSCITELSIKKAILKLSRKGHIRMCVAYRIATAAACTAVVFSSAVGTAEANLLSDPGFESGVEVVGGIGGWDTFGAAFSTDVAHAGSNSMKMTARNSVPGAFQQVSANPGEVYTMTGFGYTPATLVASTTQTPFGGIQFTFFNAGGTDLGTVETGLGVAAGDFALDPGSPAGVWLPLSVTATAPLGTSYMHAFTIFINFTGSAQGIYVDDLVLNLVTPQNQIPEPISVTLFGLSVAGLGLMRRRRAA
jgi:hypothetical protein